MTPTRRAARAFFRHLNLALALLLVFDAGSQAQRGELALMSLALVAALVNLWVWVAA